LSKSQITSSSVDNQMIQETLYKTLALVCDLNLILKNFPAARTAAKDMEQIQRNEVTTYLMKLRVLFATANEAKIGN